MSVCSNGGSFITWSGSRPSMCDLSFRGALLIFLVLWACWALARLLVAWQAARRKQG